MTQAQPGVSLEAQAEQPLSISAALAREARARPNDMAISCGEESRTWADLHLRSNRLAHALAGKGVRYGDFLTIALPNSVGFIECCYAAWKLGATPQPVSARLPAAELRAIAELAKTPLVLGESALDIGRPVLSVQELLDGTQDASDLPDRVSPAWKAPTSGGSTGRPKLIVSGAPAISDGFGAMVWKITRGDVCLMPGPLYHNGPFSTVFSALQAGARLVIMPRFDAETTLSEIARHRVTWIYLVPTMMGRIWRLPEDIRGRYDVSSLKVLWHLAAPCPPWLKQAWIDWLGPDVIREMYGGTEGQACTIITGREWLTHRGSVGKCVTGQMRAFGPDGRELAPGETGEIYMKRTDGVPPTYRYVGADARTLGDGWESLGDIGWFDEEGYLYLADRRTDMILVGGANVYPAEVEAALEEHPLVQSCAVIGLPDDDLGNRVHAIVQARAGLTTDALQAHLADRLVVYKRPRSVEFVNEALRDDAGKVRRSQLRAERLAPARSIDGTA